MVKMRFLKFLKFFAVKKDGQKKAMRKKRIKYIRNEGK